MKGAFRILDKKYEASFWRYFTNVAMHRFYPKGEGEEFIDTPWWQMEEPLNECGIFRTRRSSRFPLR